MAGDAQVVSPQAKNMQEDINEMTDDLNGALIRAAQAGLNVKVSIRSFPAVGRIARCPQVMAQVQPDTK